MNPNSYMNNHNQMYGSPDWGSIARQWASMAQVNHSVYDYSNNSYSNIPPPPPPPPAVTPLMNINPYSYCPSSEVENDHNDVVEYPKSYDKNVRSFNYCETIDYNHCVDTYDYSQDSVIPYDTSVPPPINEVRKVTPNNIGPETFSPYESIPTQKLFPVTDTYDCGKISEIGGESTNYFQNVENYAIKPEQTPKSTKGLPAWIIDDMKKMKQKERKQTVNNVDLLKDNPINSKRDEEGDVVMEDESIVSNREQEGSGIRSAGKVFSKRTDRVALNTETDIDDVSLHEDDDVLNKIDYGSKTLAELIEMVDESELESLKLMIIKDSLTGVMKEVTDSFIDDVVKECFASELTKQNESVVLYTKDCVGEVSNKSVKRQDSPPSGIGALLGLDAYESDDEDNVGEVEDSGDKENVTLVNDEKEVDNVGKAEAQVDILKSKDSSTSRAKWCTNKKSQVVDNNKHSETNLDKTKSEKNKTISPNSTSISRTTTNSTKSPVSHKKKHRHNERSRSQEKSQKRSSRSKDRQRSRRRSDRHRDERSNKDRKRDRHRSRSK